MLEITRKAKELSDIELMAIPKVAVRFTPGHSTTRADIPFGDLGYYLDIPKYQVIKIFAYQKTWDEVMADGEIVVDLPLRVFVSKTENANNYRKRYWRFELITPTRNVISGFLPERIIDYLTKTKQMTNHIILVNGEWV